MGTALRPFPSDGASAAAGSIGLALVAVGFDRATNMLVDLPGVGLSGDQISIHNDLLSLGPSTIVPLLRGGAFGLFSDAKLP